MPCISEISLEEQMFQIFRARLKKLRETNKKSRKVLSELCGLPSDAIRRYEKGEATPNVQSLVRIAFYFGVSVDYLLGLE